MSASSNHSTDGPKIVRVVAKDARTGKQIKSGYMNRKITGNGSFGVVYQTRLVDTNEDAAIKKVLQDRRFKNRELQIMRIVDHPNVCRLKSYFYNQVENKVSKQAGRKEPEWYRSGGNGDKEGTRKRKTKEQGKGGGREC
jgi:hypothetical protein